MDDVLLVVNRRVVADFYQNNRMMGNPICMVAFCTGICNMGIRASLWRSKKARGVFGSYPVVYSTKKKNLKSTLLLNKGPVRPSANLHDIEPKDKIFGSI